MAHTIEDKIIELADKYTLNHSNESYLNNKAMLEEFRAYIEQEIHEADVRKACEWLLNHNDYLENPYANVVCFNMAKLVADFRKAMKEE